MYIGIPVFIVMVIILSYFALTYEKNAKLNLVEFKAAQR